MISASVAVVLIVIAVFIRKRLKGIFWFGVILGGELALTAAWFVSAIVAANASGQSVFAMLSGLVTQGIAKP